MLEQEYPSLTLEDMSSNILSYLSYASGNQLSPKNLDILTVLKFTQLISSEIHLDKLLQKLLVIVLENAGAQRSIILSQG